MTIRAAYPAYTEGATFTPSIARSTSEMGYQVLSGISSRRPRPRSQGTVPAPPGVSDGVTDLYAEAGEPQQQNRHQGQQPEPGSRRDEFDKGSESGAGSAPPEATGPSGAGAAAEAAEDVAEMAVL